MGQVNDEANLELNIQKVSAAKEYAEAGIAPLNSTKDAPSHPSAYAETRSRALALVQREKVEYLEGLSNVKSNYLQGLLDEHPVLGTIYRHSILNRKILLTIILCEFLGSMFVDALLYDRAYGEGRIGEFEFDDYAAEEDSGDVATNVAEFVVFGIVAVIISKLPVFFIVQRLRRAKRLKDALKNFEQLSLQLVGSHITSDMPSWVIKLELQRALARRHVVERHFNAFSEEQRVQSLNVPERSFVLEIACRDISNIEVLLRKATMREQRLMEEEVKKQVDNMTLRWYESRMWNVYKLKKAYKKQKDEEGLKYLMENGLTVKQFEKVKENARYKKGLSPFKKWLYRRSFESEEEKVLSQSRYVHNLCEYSRHRKIALVCVAAWCTWCTFFCLAFAFSQSDRDIVEAWLKAFGVSVAFDFFLFSPVSILIKFVAIPTFALWYLDEHLYALQPEQSKVPDCRPSYFEEFANLEPPYEPNAEVDANHTNGVPEI